MIKINLEELKNIVSKAGAFPVTIVTKTKPKVKANCPYNITKLSTVNGMAGFIYENSVNKQRIKEDKDPDFKAEPRRWGIRIPKTPLVEHKGSFYLELKVQHSDSEYFDGKKKISREEITPYLTSSSTDKQQLDKPVILRDYSLENIKELHMNGQTYVVNE